MRRFVQAAVRDIDDVHAAIGWEPDVIPDFQDLSIEKIAPVLIAVMNLGHDYPMNMYGYLTERNFQFPFQTVEYILALFEGDDEETALWTENHDGTYSPIRRRSSKYS